jgi:hypothetical protein
LAGLIIKERSLKCCACGRRSTSQPKRQQEEFMICIGSYSEIRERAYAIFQDRLHTGRKGNALSDWLEAEHEIRRRRNPAQASMLHLHRKPNALPLNWHGFRPQPPPTRLNPESIRRSATA